MYYVLSHLWGISLHIWTPFTENYVDGSLKHFNICCQMFSVCTASAYQIRPRITTHYYIFDTLFWGSSPLICGFLLIYVSHVIQCVHVMIHVVHIVACYPAFHYFLVFLCLGITWISLNWNLTEKTKLSDVPSLTIPEFFRRYLHNKSISLELKFDRAN